MKISDALVSELGKKVDLPPKVLRAALEIEKGNVDKALLHLMDSGQIQYGKLQAREIPQKLFVRAHKGWLKARLAQQLARAKEYKHDPARAANEFGMAAMSREMLRDPDEFTDLREVTLAAQMLPEREEKLRKKKLTVKCPPFPTLTGDLARWVGRDTLTSWAGFRECERSHVSLSTKVSKGRIRIEMYRLNEDEDNPRPPAPSQVAAYRHFKEHEEEITATILKALLKRYRSRAKGVRTVADLKKHFGVSTVYLLDVAKGGCAYLGVELGCSWDWENGAGVLLHKSRVVKVGEGGIALHPGGGETDGGKQIK